MISKNNMTQPMYLSCELNKDRDVTWTKDGKRLQDAPGKYQINIIGLNRTLTIVSADDDDAGVYACTVDNTSVSCDSNVKVVGKLHTRNYTAVEKDDIVLQCEVSKAKAPVKWFKDGQEIIPSKNVIIKTDGKKRILTIKKASKKDIGEYTCDCEAPELIIDANMAREQLIKAGATLKLSAVIKGIPVPKVSWKKDEKEVSNKADIVVTPVGSKLEIRNSAKEDAGIYSLTVENEAGSKTVSLIEGLVVKAGTTVRLPAIMRGIPVPTAKWVTDSTEIKSEGNYTIDTDSFSTVLTLKECTRKDTGEYLLTVSNIAGSKTVALHLTVLDVPGPPTGPLNILEITPDHMVIAWRPPKDDGGSPVINYVVEKCEGKKLTWSIVSTGSTQTKAKVPRLQKGFEYTFRVRAENKMGIGNPLESQPTVAKHMFDPPSPPGKPVAYDITENAATVSWTMPKSDGGSPISGYIVERREISGKWVRVNKTPVLDLKYRATGLYEGNTYEFRVFAENIAGQSKPSPVSDPIKASRPISPPGPPINPKLKDKSRETADLVWTKPTRDGGSPILGYVVECQKSGTAKWDRINKDDLIRQCAFRVPGLIEGNEYRFRIKAANIVGEGEPRELPESVLAKDILHPPEVDLDVTCRDLLTVRVGQTIHISARVKGRPDPDITWSKDGKAVFKDNRTELTQDFPHVELQIKSATRTSITLGWGKPVYDGGAPIIGYIVEMRPKLERKDPEEGWKRCNAAAQLIHTQFTVTSLSDKEEYEFRVSAQNQVGVGRPAELKEAVTPKEILGNFKLLKINKICSSRKLLSQFSNDLCLIAHRTSRN
uniref:Titin n=1 Tax=Leptobrachium leishanense TaxID=445787 RepID=A0A8C5R3F8_9ANUR